ncbi:type II secretion system F family protein [Planctomicrobium sp. SH664]|uniref:type II secretion system F family protein n=1 Tax=Planctomicrobium sp. SH664 TaxID=3448125 RepID=UPI003F5C3B5F
MIALPEQASGPPPQSAPWQLAAGLRAAAENLPWGSRRNSFNRFADRLEKGSSLDLIALDPAVAPTEVREMLREGMHTGKLPVILQRYLNSVQESQSVWRQLRANLAYPLIVTTGVSLILIGMLVFVVPMFKQIFFGFGVELPPVTMLMITLSDLLILFGGWRFVCLCLVMVVLLILAIRTTMASTILNRLPILGMARRSAASAEFCSRLAVLIEAEIPLDRALEVVGSSLQDREMRRTCLQLAGRLRKGAPPTEISYGVPGLLPIVTNAFRSAENPQLLAEALQLPCKLCQVQARIRAAQLQLFLEPCLMIFAVISVLTIVYAIYAPLFTSLKSLT